MPDSVTVKPEKEESAGAGMMSIAMLSAHSCPLGRLGAKDTGGMSVYICEVAGELGKLGHKVDIYTRAHEPEGRHIDVLAPNVRLIHVRAGDPRELDKLAVHPLLPDFAGSIESFRDQNGLQYDRIFSHYWLSAVAGQLLERQWGIPHSVMFHTLGAAKNAAGFENDDPELRIETERDLVRTCRHIIAATDRDRNDLILHYGATGAQISVVPCGVNLDLFQPMNKDEAKRRAGLSGKKVILFVGRIEALKGIDRLVEAVSLLKGGNTLRLVLVGGDGHSRPVEKLRKLSRQLGMERSIEFMGAVEQRDLPLYYNAADVCVIPSFYETFGLVILESLACGTPVVATDVGTAKKVIRPGLTGYVVENNSPPLLADRIQRCLSGALTCDRVDIRATVSDHAWADVAGNLVREWQSGLTPAP